MALEAKYKNPAGGTPSSIGPQSVTHHQLKGAIITARKEQYFTPLASVENMPKNMGKKIKVFEYIPLLDDRNINDQGIDAAGATIANGNLYGSSKDIGAISSKLPTLTESGGRVNRVGFIRTEREGTLVKLGFFHEFTQESIDFDSDDELMSHKARENLNGAVQISEAMLQIDLLTSAGVVVYAGTAVSHATMTGEGATPSVVDYGDFARLETILDDNRTPKQTTVITGSRLVDTKVINGGRVMYIGSEMKSVLEKMKDYFNNQAFIPVAKYASAGTVLNGEWGTIGGFRLVVVPEMLSWQGVGVVATGGNLGYRTGAASKYNVYPLLVVGDDAFSTIGFQTDGKTVKFDIIVKKPGKETADRTDPYGETGFASIKWYYGFLVKRPERIAVIKSVAEI